MLFPIGLHLISGPIDLSPPRVRSDNDLSAWLRQGLGSLQSKGIQSRRLSLSKPRERLWQGLGGLQSESIQSRRLSLSKPRERLRQGLDSLQSESIQTTDAKYWQVERECQSASRHQANPQAGERARPRAYCHSRQIGNLQPRIGKRAGDQHAELLGVQPRFGRVDLHIGIRADNRNRNASRGVQGEQRRRTFLGERARRAIEGW
jgi:hypothetical protein